jgi:hypothetical protein
MITLQPFQVVPEGLLMVADIDGAVERITFTARGAELVASTDAGLAALLLPTMRVGGPLVVRGATSLQLVASLPKIQQIIRNWEQRFPSYAVYRAVTVDAPNHVESPPPRRRRVAAFFSGGVDSFYTLAQHRDEIDALVYVHGFDVAIDDERLDEQVTSQLRAAALALNKPLVEIRTDLRTFSDRYSNWLDYHGSALASIALLLATEFERMYVPATLTYAHLIPLGSHPLLDPLWSTENVELIHDGCEASRLDKLALLANDPVAQAHLRVCWENRKGRYNCGSCEKCLRTMVALRALGVLSSFETFPDTIKPSAIAKIELPEIRYTWEASLALLKKTGNDPTLARTLERRLYNSRVRLLRTGVRYARRFREMFRS